MMKHIFLYEKIVLQKKNYISSITPTKNSNDGKRKKKKGKKRGYGGENSARINEKWLTVETHTIN